MVTGRTGERKHGPAVDPAGGALDGHREPAVDPAGGALDGHRRCRAAPDIPAIARWIELTLRATSPIYFTGTTANQRSNRLLELATEHGLSRRRTSVLASPPDPPQQGSPGRAGVQQ